MQDLDSRAQHLRWEALLQTHMDEREAYLAAEGLTVRSPTPEQETSAVCSDVSDLGRLQDQTCRERFGLWVRLFQEYRDKYFDRNPGGSLMPC